VPRRSPLWTPRWLVGHVLVLAVVVAFSQFGTWQLRRHAEHTAATERAAARWAAAPVDLETALADAASEAAAGASLSAALLDRRVTVAGVFEPQDEVLRRPVSRDGSPGYHVVTPLRLEGDVEGRRLWVERGWVPEAWNTPVPVDAAPPPEGRVEVTGWLRATEAPPTGWVGALAPRDPPTGRLRAVAYLDPVRLADQVAGPLVPAVLLLESVVPPAPAPWPRPPEPPVASSGPHLGYAIQWFSFTLVTLIGYVALLRRTSREG
jgi:surfeit locus 1 family protein